MDINLKITLESPHLMAAMLALAEALPHIKLGSTIQLKEGQTVEAKDTVYKSKNNNEEAIKVEIKKEEVKIITLEEVRAKLASLSKDGKQKEVKALINKFGASKLVEVLAENYEALLKEAETL